MQAWIEFFIILGKIFFVILVGLATALVLYGIGKWLDKSGEVDKQAKPVDGTNWLVYDSEGRIKQKGDELRKITNKKIGGQEV